MPLWESGFRLVIAWQLLAISLIAVVHGSVWNLELKNLKQERILAPPTGCMKKISLVKQRMLNQVGI